MQQLEAVPADTLSSPPLLVKEILELRIIGPLRQGQVLGD